MAQSIYLNRNAIRFAVLGLIFLVFMLAWVGDAQAQSTILDNIGNKYKQAAGEWSSTLESIARGLFLKLVLLEVVWFGIMFVLEKDDPREFMVALLKKLVALLFFFAILENFDSWIPAVVNGFAQAGATAAELPTLTPSAIMERGLNLATIIFEKISDLGLTDVGPFFLAVLVGLMILIAFVVISGQMLVTLIESYIVLGAGVLFLGFAGSRWTTTFAEKFISYAVSVGVKLFVTYLIIGAGQTLSNDWAAIIQAAEDPSGYLEVLGGAIVYTFLAFQIPSLASSMLTGSVSMTLGGLTSTAGALGAAGVGAAAATTAAVTGVANGAGALGKTIGAAIGASKAGGASGVLGVAAGAIGAAGSAAAGAVVDGIKGLGGSAGGLAGRMNASAAALTESKAASAVSAPSVPGGSTPSSSSSAPAAQAPAPSAPSGPANPGAGSSAPSGGTSSAASSGQTPQSASSGSNSEGSNGSQTGASSVPAGSSESAPSSSLENAGGAQPEASSVTPSSEQGQSSAPANEAPAPASGAPADSAVQAQPAPTTNSSTASQTAQAQPAPTTSSSTASQTAQTQPSRPTPPPPGVTQPRPPEPPSRQVPPKPTLTERLQEASKGMGELPNDAAPGAGVQINLKAD
ncbi:MAG: P-type conjugative transfer protein TrbL [Methylotenera sp.]|nr:MAG: P-type conjugative transfer protein TrbL [Methylotenera sp.]